MPDCHPRMDESGVLPSGEYTVCSTPGFYLIRWLPARLNLILENDAFLPQLSRD